jgi:adenosylhomocysteine nucleosidase
LASEAPAAGITIGVVVGLAAEARIARRLGWPVAIGGGGAAGAETAAIRLAASGVGGLLSFGLCGGLDPALPAGALIIPDTVLAGGTRYATDPAIAAQFGGAMALTVVAQDTAAVSAAAKQLLRAATGAAAVDLESGAVARVASAHGLPFAVIRAVCDPAGQDLPPAAIAALDADGAISLLRVLGSVARHPGQLPALLALARQAAAARAALLSVVLPRKLRYRNV